MGLWHAGPAKVHTAQQADALCAKLCCCADSRQATGAQHSKQLQLLSSSDAVPVSRHPESAPCRDLIC